MAKKRKHVWTRPVPMSKWAKDHWSAFAYLETRVVDKRGIPDIEHMRCDRARHPGLAHRGSYGKIVGTKLKGGAIRKDHDDWDCIDDIEAAGLIKIGGTGINPVWKLTKAGNEMAGRLRAHKGDGGRFAEFEPTAA